MKRDQRTQSLELNIDRMRRPHETDITSRKHINYLSILDNFTGVTGVDAVEFTPTNGSETPESGDYDRTEILGQYTSE